MTDYAWVLPNIAVGSAPTSSDVQSMIADGITDVLDLRAEANSASLYQGTNINYQRDPMVDNGQTQPVSAYQLGVQIIENALAQPGHKILVHCQAGEYRSPSMVYAYLRVLGYSPTDAWNAITAVRPTANNQYIAGAEAAVPYLPQPPTAGTSIASVLLLVGGIGLLGTAAYLYAAPLKNPSRRRRRRNPVEHWLWYTAGAVGAAGIGYMLYERQQLPDTVFTPTPGQDVTVQSDGSMTYGQATAQLLQSNQTARQLFAFQGIAYLYGASDTLPSGQMDANTQALMTRFYGDVGQEVPAFSANSITVEAQAIAQEHGGRVPAPVNPGSVNLPTAALQDAVMAEIPAAANTILTAGA
jgi:hypothetical protein